MRMRSIRRRRSRRRGHGGSGRPAVTSAASASASTNVIHDPLVGRWTRPARPARPACQEPSSGGPVWAIDSLTEKWSVSAYAQPQSDGANYSVLLDGSDGQQVLRVRRPADRQAGVGTEHGARCHSVRQQLTPRPLLRPPSQTRREPTISLGAVIDRSRPGHFTTVGGGNYDFACTGARGSLNGGTAPLIGSQVTGTFHGTLKYEFFTSAALSRFKDSRLPTQHWAACPVTARAPSSGPSSSPRTCTQFWDTSGNTGGAEQLGSGPVQLHLHRGAEFTARHARTCLAGGLTRRLPTATTAVNPMAGNILAPGTGNC